MAIAVIFPGQGTQQSGMAAPWRDHEAWRVVDQAEAALGEPLAPLVLDAPPEQLARTREAQLAVLLTSLVAWEAVRDQVDAPIAFAGHSLGQVTALIAADALPLDEGVRFAARRAELTQAAATRIPAAWPRSSAPRSSRPSRRAGPHPDACWIANDNAPGQVVIAGTPDGVESGSGRAKEIGVKRATPLNVGGAFHTPLMRTAADALPSSSDRPTVGTDGPGWSPTAMPSRTRMATAGGRGWRSTSPSRSAGAPRWRRSPISARRNSSKSATARCSRRWRSAPCPIARSSGVATPDDLPRLTEVP